MRTGAAGGSASEQHSAQREQAAIPGISDDAIWEVRERARIEDVAAAYTTLRRSGRSLKGRCPLHDERTASFVVTPAKGLWRCFGCDAGGDSVELVARLEQVRFPEAVRRLAERIGYRLD